MKKHILILLILTTINAFSQNNNPSVSFVNSKTLATPAGYSQAAVTDLGNSTMIILSGQVPLDKQGALVDKDNFEKQPEQVFTNIKNAVTELGGSMDNIVKFGYFVSGINQMQKLRPVRNKYINTKNPAASTLIQVSKLYCDDVILEVEATAILPKMK